jgi:hypothetical protein
MTHDEDELTNPGSGLLSSIEHPPESEEDNDEVTQVDSQNDHLGRQGLTASEDEVTPVGIDAELAGLPPPPEAGPPPVRRGR